MDAEHKPTQLDVYNRLSREQLRNQEEKVAELRRKEFRDGMRRVELPDEVIEGLEGAHVKVRENYKARSQYPLNDQEPDGTLTEVEVLDPSERAYDAEVSDLAGRTPEVRFSKRRMTREFTDDELKIIAAALRSRSALYRVADSLHCSYAKIRKAIEDIPVLKELAEERTFREKEEAQEAVDDCVKARVPAVVMWNAEKVLPEKYGNQVNLDNEDDTRLVIGAIPEDEVEAAEAEVALASESIPQIAPNAVMQSLEDERAAENAAAGGGVPSDPLRAVPPAPALYPPSDDPRFSPFVPASQMKRVQEDVGENNYGDVGGGGFDDMDDGSWI